MIYNEETKEIIEDSLIHLEDKGYNISVNYYFFICYDNNPIPNKNIVLNKRMDYLINDYATSDSEIIIGDIIKITLSKESSGVMSFNEYNDYHISLRTAITRMKIDLNDVMISEDDFKNIWIIGDTWRFKNLKVLRDNISKFNNRGLISKRDKVVVYPEFDTDSGISLYIKEIIKNPFHDRFSYFDEEDENRIKSIFGEDSIEKIYEEDNEVQKENPYLIQSSLSKFIVAKIKCDFIKI